MNGEFATTDIATGMYEQIPFATYKDWPLMNGSTLLAGLNSMAHLKVAMEGPDTDSPARKFGRAVHCRLLEPDEYHTRFWFSQPCSAKLKSGKNAGSSCGLAGHYVNKSAEWFCGKHAGDECEMPEDYVCPEEADYIEQLAEVVKGHPVVKMFRDTGGVETSIVWEAKGVRLKSRLDKLVVRDDPQTILDIKKVRVGFAKPEPFARDLNKYGYYVKAAMYQDAVEYVTGHKCAVVFVAIEDSPPFGIVCHRVGEYSLMAGRIDYQRLLIEYARCLKTGEFPGYDPQVVETELPDWKLQQYQYEFKL